MAQQLLHRADVVAVLQQVGREAVPERVTAGGLGDARRVHRGADRALDGLRVDVVSHCLAGTGIAAEGAGRKDVLPAPVDCGMRVLAPQRERQRNAGPARRPVGGEQRAHAGQVSLQMRYQHGRQHGDPVLRALAVTHHQLATGQVQVLDAQLQAFLQPDAGAVEQAGHQPVRARQEAQHALNLVPRQHDRQPLRAARPDDRVQPGQGRLQHLPVQEQERCERLVLGTRRDLAVHSQVRQEPFDIDGTKAPGMLVAAEPDETVNPVEVRLFSPQAVVQAANPAPDHLQQARP
jgi:hypothetical protein